MARRFDKAPEADAITFADMSRVGPAVVPMTAKVARIINTLPSPTTYTPGVMMLPSFTRRVNDGSAMPTRGLPNKQPETPPGVAFLSGLHWTAVVWGQVSAVEAGGTPRLELHTCLPESLLYQFDWRTPLSSPLEGILGLRFRPGTVLVTMAGGRVPSSPTFASVDCATIVRAESGVGNVCLRARAEQPWGLETLGSQESQND